MLIEKLQPRTWDDRRELIVPGDAATTLIFCVEHFISLATQAIKDHDAFFVALSGGSTPKEIFKTLCASPYKELMKWDKCHFFWSDERAVPPENTESNYSMAMQAGLSKMPIPPHQIHRMHAEEDIEKNALAYEQDISIHLKAHPFDLVMLGLGEDGHTASLFPHTQGLTVSDHLVTTHFVPQKNTWRMTLTYPCINQASHIAIYVLGASKKAILSSALFSTSDLYPIEKIGTPTHKALWIADQVAAEGLASKKERTFR